MEEYPFRIDPPMPPGMRNTLLGASVLGRVWRSITGARDQRLKDARGDTQTPQDIESANVFRAEMRASDLDVVSFDDSMNALMGDEVSTKHLLAALGNKSSGDPELDELLLGQNRSVDELLRRCGAAPRQAAQAASSPPASRSPSPRPGRARTAGFRWEYTSEATRGESSGPPPVSAANDVRAPKVPSAATGAPTAETAAPSPPVAVEGTVAMPAEYGVVVALDDLSKQAQALLARLQALEALVESQAKRLEEADRKLETVLKRLEAREEVARRHTEIQTRIQQELAELGDRVARLEGRGQEAVQPTPSAQDMTGEPPDARIADEPSSSPSFAELGDRVARLEGRGEEEVQRQPPQARLAVQPTPSAPSMTGEPPDGRIADEPSSSPSCVAIGEGEETTTDAGGDESDAANTAPEAMPPAAPQSQDHTADLLALLEQAKAREVFLIEKLTDHETKISSVNAKTETLEAKLGEGDNHES